MKRRLPMMRTIGSIDKLPGPTPRTTMVPSGASPEKAAVIGSVPCLKAGVA